MTRQNLEIKLGDLLIDRKTNKKFSIIVKIGVNKNSYWVFHLNGVLKGNILLLPKEFIEKNFYIEQQLIENI